MPARSTTWRPADGEPACWALSFTLAQIVEIPGIGRQSRTAFLGWLWERLADCGLRGLGEGEVSAHEAADLGLVPAPLVIDAGAAPADRDWVAEMPAVTATGWFDDEASARQAAGRLTGLAGCAVLAVRPVACRHPEAWREAFTTVEVPGFGCVRPAWEPGRAATAAEGTTLFVEPGIGFGTGLHPTTQLCLAAIDAAFRAPVRPHRVVDFGSGSGILAVAAAVLGATRVAAVESDASVHAAIRMNAVRNDVGDRVGVATSLTKVAGVADLVVANIVAAVLLEHAERLCALVAPDPAGRPAGRQVLSGLRPADVDGVAGRFAELLGKSPERASRDGWEALVWPGGPAGCERR